MLAQLQVSELTWALQKQQPKFVLPKHNELLLSAGEECRAAAVSRLADKAAAQHYTAGMAQAGPRLLPGAVGQHPARCLGHLRQGGQAGGQLPKQLHLGPLHYRRTTVDWEEQLLRILVLYEGLAGDTVE